MKDSIEFKKPISNNDNELNNPINIEAMPQLDTQIEIPDPFYQPTDHEIWMESLAKKPFSELLLYEQSFLEVFAEVDKKYGAFQLTTSPKKYTPADLANHSDKVLKLLENYKDLKMISTNRDSNDFIDTILTVNREYKYSDNPAHMVEHQKFKSKIKEIVADEQNIPLLESWGAKKEDIDLLRGDKAAIKAIAQNNKEGNIFVLGEKLRTLEFSLELQKSGENLYSGEYWDFVSRLYMVVPHKSQMISFYFYNNQTYNYINENVENNNTLLLISYAGNKAWDSKFMHNNYFKPAEKSFKYISILGNGRGYVDNDNTKKFLEENITKYKESNIIFINISLHGTRDSKDFAEIVENLPVKTNKEGIVIYFFESCHGQYYHDYLVKNPAVIEHNTLYITPAPYSEGAYSGDMKAEQLFSKLNTNAHSPIKTVLEHFKDYESTSKTDVNKVYITGIIQGKTYHNEDIHEVYNNFDVEAEKIDSAQKLIFYDPTSEPIELEETATYVDYEELAANAVDISPNYVLSYELDNGASGTFNISPALIDYFLNTQHFTGKVKISYSPENEKYYRMNNGVFESELTAEQFASKPVANDHAHSKGFWKYLKHLCCVSNNEREAEESNEVIEGTLESASLLLTTDMTGENLNCNDHESVL